MRFPASTSLFPAADRYILVYLIMRLNVNFPRPVSSAFVAAPGTRRRLSKINIPAVPVAARTLHCAFSTANRFRPAGSRVPVSPFPVPDPTTYASSRTRQSTFPESRRQAARGAYGRRRPDRPVSS